jgi:hypothetical protein
MGIHIDSCCILRLGTDDYEFAGNLTLDSDLFLRALEIYYKKHKDK